MGFRPFGLPGWVKRNANVMPARVLPLQSLWLTCPQPAGCLLP